MGAGQRERRRRHRRPASRARLRGHRSPSSRAVVRRLVGDDSIAAVIGPDNSEDARKVVSTFFNKHKLIVTPSATAADLFRAFSGNQPRYFWRPVESDIAQVRTLLMMAAGGGATSVGLVTGSSEYGDTFYLVRLPRRGARLQVRPRPVRPDLTVLRATDRSGARRRSRRADRGARRRQAGDLHGERVAGGVVARVCCSPTRARTRR